MKKLISVLKATMSGDMNIFKIKTQKTSDNSKKMFNKLLIGFLIFTFLMMAFTYAYMFAEPLKAVNKTYVMLELFGIMVSIIALMECVYKSQGILFEAKDNDLLFSMPITKRTIMSARLIKLLSFEYIFDTLFFIPAIIVYAILEPVSVTYWISSIAMLLVLPIVPTIIGSIIGYIIKMFSSKFKKGKIIQTIITIIFMIAIMYFSFNLQNLLVNIGNNADNISNILSQIYYPIKLYTSLIQSFNIIDLGILLLINIVLFTLFIILFSISYFKIISKSSEVVKNKKYKLKDKQRTQLTALLKKDFKNFFASPVFMVNAGIGLVILVLLSILVCVNFDGIVQNIIERSNGAINQQDIINNMPLIFLGFLAFVIPLSMISSAIISIEGKSFNLTKTLPISGKKILLSKTLMTDIIIILPVLVSILMVAIRFDFGIIYTIEIIILSGLLTNITATLGLIINLIFPKMDAKNDTEAVKQNISTFIATFAGFGLFGLSIGLCSMFGMLFAFNIVVCLMMGVYIVLNLANYLILINYGVNRLKKI